MFALFNTEQPFQMPTSSICFTGHLNPGVVYLRKYAADVEQVLVPLKLKMTFFSQLCVYVQRVNSGIISRDSMRKDNGIFMNRLLHTAQMQKCA